METLTKICTVCKEDLPAEKFYASKGKRDGLSSSCMPCVRERTEERKRKIKAMFIPELSQIKCKKCLLDLPVENYSRSYSNNNGYSNFCKDCLSDDNSREYLSRALKKMGITAEEHNMMLEKQNNKCAICQEPGTTIDPKRNKVRRLAIDHCHKTGKVRGLLCNDCNLGLGKFKDKKQNLINALNYLES